MSRRRRCPLCADTGVLPHEFYGIGAALVAVCACPAGDRVAVDVLAGGIAGAPALPVGCNRGHDHEQS